MGEIFVKHLARQAETCVRTFLDSEDSSLSKSGSLWGRVGHSNWLIVYVGIDTETSFKIII